MGLLRIGDNAPEFNVDGFFQGKVTKYSLAGCKGKWLVLFFYPADFTFICPTEVTGFSKMAHGLRRRKRDHPRRQRGFHRQPSLVGGRARRFGISLA